ncbi:hypothetical protein BV22DRAFT_271709 [Leucogyrophana mollusca]|uniref:Uncharacterized protein n=1 Tax=Leucogyrophana mollusca TaxID=85980 RepID=A0ACB8BNM3_9AGAM|nr:hypothetical protein BV22DRAFT_271709 [Leucogyrophana mollusca]
MRIRMSRRPPIILLAALGLPVICEMITALVPSSPPALTPSFSFLSSVMVLPLVIALLSSAIPRGGVDRSEAKPPRDFEKGTPSSGRVSSPTADTWPFPASLAHTPATAHDPHSPAKSTRTIATLPASLTLTLERQEHARASMEGVHCPGVHHRLAVALVVAQLAAVTAGATELGFVLNKVSALSVVHAVCVIIWTICVMLCIFLLPIPPLRSLSLTQTGPELPSAPEIIPKPPTLVTRARNKSTTSIRERKQSISPPFNSDSASDFLSLHDPFASPPPPPPPPPSVRSSWTQDKDNVRLPIV